jgi:hypothetical protein
MSAPASSCCDSFYAFARLLGLLDGGYERLDGDDGDDDDDDAISNRNNFRRRLSNDNFNITPSNSRYVLLVCV